MENIPQGIRLYPGMAPGSEKLDISEEMFLEERGNTKKQIVQNVTVPQLIPFVTGQSGQPAVIIIPGGAFRRQVLNLEGTEVAQWLNGMGIAAFVLKTRLPVNAHENPYDVMLMDVQRAIRIVRGQAEKWGIRKDCIGVMGFSAGGYQAALAATAFDRKVYEPVDSLDEVSARPDFCVLGYPAIACEVQDSAQEQRAVTGPDHPVAEYERQQLLKYRPHEMLSENTPPIFLFETDDDRTTPAENSVAFYLAARKKRVPAELHIFKSGKHGFGLGETKEQAGAWKELFAKWAKVMGIIS